MQYRIEGNKIAGIGHYDWINNSPFDGIEITDEPFTMEDFWLWELVDGKWIKNEETINTDTDTP